MFKRNIYIYTCITNNTMADITISVRVPQEMYEKMKQLEYIKWSAIIRDALRRYIQNTEQQSEQLFDKERACKAVEHMDKLRKSGAFSKGKSSVEIIREWRDKRK